MPYIFASLILAMVFGLTTHSIYGVEGLYEQPWVDRVFWMIIAGGTSLAGLNILRCTICRWMQRTQGLCSETICTDI